MGGEARKIEKEIRRGAEKTLGSMTGLGLSGVTDTVRDVKEAEKEAKKAKQKQEQAIARREQQEGVKLAEAEDEIARRRLLKRAGGRQSLIASR